MNLALGILIGAVLAGGVGWIGMGTMYRLGRRHGRLRLLMEQRHRAERGAEARERAMMKIRLIVLQGKMASIRGEAEPEPPEMGGRP